MTLPTLRELEQFGYPADYEALTIMWEEDTTTKRQWLMLRWIPASWAEREP